MYLLVYLIFYFIFTEITFYIQKIIRKKERQASVKISHLVASKQAKKTNNNCFDGLLLKLAVLAERRNSRIRSCHKTFPHAQTRSHTPLLFHYMQFLQGEGQVG